MELVTSDNNIYDKNIDKLTEKYINKMANFWNNMLNSKYYKYSINMFSITHLTGIHIDFYHKPYLFLNKKYPELIFRNIIFKKIIELNRFLYKEMYLPKQSIEIMIKQCDMATNNKSYWLRNGYSEFQYNIIEETYKIFKNYLTDYLKYINNFKNDNKVVGLGKNTKGDLIYEYLLKYHTGFTNVSPEFIQKFGIMRMENTIKQIESYTNKSFSQAKIDYIKSLKYFDNETDFMSEAQNNIIKLRTFALKLFDKTVDIPYPEKISVKPIPELRALWGSKAKAQDKTLFINTLQWKKIDINTLLRICAHEAIPGHIIERYNTNKILDKFKINKKILSQMKKGVTATKEGWAIYAEKLISDLFQGDKILNELFSDLYQAIIIILDVGLNSSKAEIKFDIDSAKKFLRNYSLLDEESINNDILKYLAKPAVSSCYGFGYYCIKDIQDSTPNIDKVKFNSLFFKLPLSLSLTKDFMNETNKLSSHNTF